MRRRRSVAILAQVRSVSLRTRVSGSGGLRPQSSHSVQYWGLSPSLPNNYSISMPGWGCRSCHTWNNGSRAKCHGCGAFNPNGKQPQGLPPQPPRGQWEFGPPSTGPPWAYPRKFLRSPWVQQGQGPAWSQQQQGWQAQSWSEPQPLSEEEKAQWVGMDEGTFRLLCGRLSQSQRDKLLHARRLKAAGQSNILQTT